MKLLEILRKSFVIVMLSFMAVGMMSACSSSEESSSSSGGGEDCSKYTNEVDRKECEVRNADI